MSPPVQFPKGWDIHHSENHWSNQQTILRFIDTILLSYIHEQRDRLNLPLKQPALAIFDVYAELSYYVEAASAKSLMTFFVDFDIRTRVELMLAALVDNVEDVYDGDAGEDDDPKPPIKASKMSLSAADNWGYAHRTEHSKSIYESDVKNGVWHATLAEESSYLTTFEAPFEEYFISNLEREIEALPGVKTVADDILVYGEGDTFEAANQPFKA
ncbi:unnamed protein product [Mytilus coruscus]|uniref:Uncharacterized protein n=1 Tax=Mytilus coruscus TaxID=42192 RepID=A0A6J8A845_MYTCO|nr:unnamed protein product [Mytilus coruscus]